MTEPRNFDVFLSHNSRDKTAVRKLAQALLDRGLRPWLDEWELSPGRSWQDVYMQVIREARSVAVLIGSDGIGPWQILEQKTLLVEASRCGLPVIPVLLPHAPETPDLPIFLSNRHYIDMRQGLSNENLDHLVRGIIGTRHEPVFIRATNVSDFDVFLCFRDSDRPEVNNIANALKRVHVRCWPDDWSISPQESWTRLLSRRNQKINAIAVFATDDGGPWEEDEVESFIWEQIESGQLVIPVILPNASREPKFPVYLRRKHPIDWRRPDPELEISFLLSRQRDAERGSQND